MAPPRGAQGHKVGDRWLALCPAHDDHNASLNISDGRDGKVLVKCWAGCTQDSVIAALRARGLWPVPRNSGLCSSLPNLREHAETDSERERAEREDRIRAAKLIWDASETATGRPPLSYLARCGICLPVFGITPKKIGNGTQTMQGYELEPILKTKSGCEFWLPLNDAHHRILDSVRGLDERWVFPGRGASGHGVAWDHSEVPGTLHSLRHTFATVAVEAGIPEEVVGRLLNHASKTITGQRYVKPKLDFLRAAMEEIVAELECRLAG